MSRTAFLHVGIAKTGTTFLQRRLFANRDSLREHGVLYPGPGPGAHFLGSLDLRGTTFKGHSYDGVEGAWDRLVQAANEFPGNTLISHETLARAKSGQIRRAVEGFAAEQVRVVITARDVARQVPAVWQETLKNRGETRYEDYAENVFAHWRPEGRATGEYWAAQDVEAVVRRWAAVVGEARVTVVTVPPKVADRDELWRRFALATELPDLDFAEGPGAGNSSLGAAEAEVLRRLNPMLADALDWPAYDFRVKRRLAEEVLSPLASYGRLVLDPRWTAAADAVASAQVGFVSGSGVAVVGDVADLRPAGAPPEGAEPARQPDQLSEGELLEAALRGLAALTAAPLLAPPTPTERRGLTAAALVARRRLATLARRLAHPRPPAV